MEEDAQITAQGEDRKLVQQFLAQGGTPAFAARSQQTQQAWDKVLRKCQQQRDEWLTIVRIRLGTLQALCGEWSALSPWLDTRGIALLEELHTNLQPKLRVPIARTTSPKALLRALTCLKECLGRFNKRWSEFLPKVNLNAVNELREKYNRYYLIEKECFVRSPVVARRGFTPLPPATMQDLEAEFPFMPVVEIPSHSREKRLLDSLIVPK